MNKTKHINNDDLAADSFVARQILQEILDFGVSQSQLVKLIQMLSMELENRALMVGINECITESLEENVSSKNESADLITDV
tara:strand:+ start:250 stop:495 length:246 start_codon:yes stop_codon:yes gene_type:complete